MTESELIGNAIPITRESIHELVDAALADSVKIKKLEGELQKLRNKIEDLKETTQVINEKNDELLEDICNEQDYNVLLWDVIAQLKGFKTL